MAEYSSDASCCPKNFPVAVEIYGPYFWVTPRILIQFHQYLVVSIVTCLFHMNYLLLVLQLIIYVAVVNRC